MTTVCVDVLETALETARGAVATLRALPSPADDTGVPSCCARG
ncbi:hypothetical protein ACFPIJ_59850 [Dactylosporangium cerinum]|uniref:Uncharacterized protein n=1 Tax=Dactylosporangium cerinum TaxID=1434730 RepID=A0ABV9WKN5_9ACTN